MATRTDAMRPSDLARVVIDTTVQPKAVMFPTDAKLLNRARERLVRLAKKLGVSLRQSYARVGLRVTDELGPEKAARSSVDDSHRQPGVAIRRGDLFRSMRCQYRERRDLSKSELGHLTVAAWQFASCIRSGQSSC